MKHRVNLFLLVKQAREAKKNIALAEKSGDSASLKRWKEEYLDIMIAAGIGVMLETSEISDSEMQELEEQFYKNGLQGKFLNWRAALL